MNVRMYGFGSQAGVTLIEMMVAVAIMATFVAVAFPSVNSGLDSLRLRSASQAIAGVLNQAFTTAVRKQEALEIVVSANHGYVMTRELEANAETRFELPRTIQIIGSSEDVRYVVYPDGAPPRITVDLVNDRGFHRRIAVNPVIGAAYDCVR